MEWQEASELLYRQIGRHGSYVGRIKGGFAFAVNTANAKVFDDGRVLVDEELIKKEAPGKPKKVSPQQVGVPTGTETGGILAMIGENVTVHMAIVTPTGVATACNPKKTFYSTQGAVRAVDGSLDQVTCKVCGWAIAKLQKGKK